MLSRNLADYGTVFFGVARTGYVLVNVSVLYAPDELTFVLNKADAEVLIFDSVFADKVAAVRADTPRIRTFVSLGPAADVAGRAPSTISSAMHQRQRRRFTSTRPIPSA